MVTTPTLLALFVHLDGSPSGGDEVLPGEWGGRLLQAGTAAAIGPAWAVDGVSWEALRATNRALGGGAWEAVLGVALRRPQAVVLYLDAWTERDALQLTPLLREALPQCLVITAGPGAESGPRDAAGVAAALAEHAGAPMSPAPPSAPISIDLFGARGVPTRVAGKTIEDLRTDLRALVRAGPTELSIEDLHRIDPDPVRAEVVELLIDEFPVGGPVELAVRIQARGLEDEAIQRLRGSAGVGTIRLVAALDTDPEAVPEADRDQVVIERTFPLPGDSPEALYSQLQGFLSRGIRRIELCPSGPPPYAALATREFPQSGILEAAALGRILAWGERPDRTPEQRAAWARHLQRAASVDEAVTLLRSGMAPDVALGSILLDIFGPRALDDLRLHAPTLAAEAHLAEPPQPPEEEIALPGFAPLLAAWLEESGSWDVEVASEGDGVRFTAVTDQGSIELRILPTDSDEDCYTQVGPWKIAYSGRFPGAELMDGLVGRLRSAVERGASGGA